MTPKIIFSRKELYDLVWSQPLQLFTKKYVVSEQRLRKICKDMQIPLPNSGHWARLPVNRVAPSKLSALYYGEEKIELDLRGKKDDSEKIAIKEREEEFRTGHVMSPITGNQKHFIIDNDVKRSWKNK